jgi:adenine-specific DNA-methyltransferase
VRTRTGRRAGARAPEKRFLINEIIKVHNDKGEVEEKWTGNYLFENEWQSFRTKKNPTLEFTSIAYEYKKAGKYKVMVKVVDILGIDTSKIIEVNIK